MSTGQRSGVREDTARFPITVRTAAGQVDRSGVREVLRSCLEAESVVAGASIGLLFCGDRAMKELNAQFRGKDRTTDVLSFPEDPGLDGAGGPGGPGGTGGTRRGAAESHGAPGVGAVDLEPGDGPFLGDIAVSLPQCILQAREQAVDPGEELVRLLVHGVLHLLGHDHMEAEERKRMVARERVCRRRAKSLGLGPGLLIARPGGRTVPSPGSRRR
ncbi:MAG: rRNA maturation RNase YbeY [Candidatus Eisenbacteria bacterium]